MAAALGRYAMPMEAIAQLSSPALQPPGAACTGADLVVGEDVAGEPRDLGLLGGELAAGIDGEKIAFDAGLASKGQAPTSMLPDQAPAAPP
jgi:hypothetical protein